MAIDAPLLSAFSPTHDIVSSAVNFSFTKFVMNMILQAPPSDQWAARPTDANRRLLILFFSGSTLEPYTAHTRGIVYHRLYHT